MKFYVVEIIPKNGKIRLDFESWVNALEWLGDTMEVAQEDDTSIGTSITITVKETEKP